ncbi:MAG: amidohydrolase [Flavobacteriales bacterium]|nr:amidohydrolase [Flavobacteriales bacterium]
MALDPKLALRMKYSSMLSVAVFLTGCYHTEDADLVVHNAIIHSMDEANTTYQAMAVRDGRIIELGPERQIMNRYAATVTYDAQGRPVYPGFIDGHCHFFGYGLNKQKIDLQGVRSWDEAIERTALFAKAHPKSDWILGRGWDQNLWADKTFPDNDELNELFPDRPIFLQRVDGHAAVVNQAALDRVGLSANSAIAGGILELRNGKPTGLIVDNVADLFQKIFEDAEQTAKRQALLDAQTDCFEKGLTMVCDAGLDVGTIELIQQLQSEGLLKIRVYAMVADKPENLEHFAKAGPIDTDRLWVRSVKVYGDGSLGSRGALLKEPYSDVDSAYHGLLRASRTHMLEVANWCAQHDFQMVTHCIGDSMDGFMLDVYAEVLKGTNDKRWRIEHAQCMDPRDMHLFAENSIIPSVQPTHLLSDAPWAIDRLGQERFKTAYAWNSLRKQIGMVALGTDFPVEDIDPLATFYAAVVRKYRDGSEIVGSPMAEALSREDALRGMTIWNAIASFTENDLGSLETGKRADLVVLNGDPLKVDAEMITKLRVEATFVNGEQVH